MRKSVLCAARVIFLAMVVFTTAIRGANIPEWAKGGRIAGLSIQSNADALTIESAVARLKDQNVSIVELDTSLSRYWLDEEFQNEVLFIGQVTDAIHAAGMKVVVYYPALEVLTPDGETNPRSAAKDYPEWLQIGINGESNVFYGSQEDWVPPGGESAWMSPNSGYRNYFISRVKKLATETDLDGIWIDVPLYLDTGSPWSDMSPNAKIAYENWSQLQGYNDGLGYTLPTVADISDLNFRMWLEWRHINLAEFIEEVRTESILSNPNWLFVAEVYPMDYLDTLWTGLDGARLQSQDKWIRVWEVDSVSNGMAMKYAHVEDVSNRIAMYKYARGVDRNTPSWGFTYGFEVPDAGLGIGAAIATKTIPFETKTPIMTESVDGNMRKQWYGFIKDREDALFKTERLSRVGVWFSSPTREYYDYSQGGKYGMFLQEQPPVEDPEWWAQFVGASLIKLPHVSAWRGAAHGLHQLGIPYKCVVDPALPSDLDELEVLWLPSVVCLSEEKATDIKNFVEAGGTVIATGLLPGTSDEFGSPRSQSVLDELFQFGGNPVSKARLMEYGLGAAIYRPDIISSELFTLEGGNVSKAQSTLGQLEQLLRIHTTEDLVGDLPKGTFIDISKVNAANEQYLYILNYSGALQPMQISPKTYSLQYLVPEGNEVVSITLSSPGDESDVSIPFARTDLNHVGFDVPVEQFALVKIQLSASNLNVIPNTAELVYDSSEIEEVVQSGLNFILKTMREATGKTEPPYSYGVPTNLKDNNFSTAVYTGGHHVTAEHMGLLLRVTALTKNEQAFQEAVTFVQDVLLSKGYSVPGWSMDKINLERFLQKDSLDGQDVWFAANAPLDDFRIVRGLLQGAERMGNDQAQELAETILNGLYWTSVTDRFRGAAPIFPQYADGLIGYSWDWADQDDPTLSPPAEASGLGRLGTFPIPVDYQDLETMALAAKQMPRWEPVLSSSVDLLLNSEIPGSPGLFYNGYTENNAFTGDFEYPGERQGENLKVIQELWTILHLKRVSSIPVYVLKDTKRVLAAGAAARGYQFFKNFYLQNGRVPEYLTFQGGDVPECGPEPDGNCLVRGNENLFEGEARIYAQLARIALLMGEKSFAYQIITEKILTDRVGDSNDPQYGKIGISTASEDDAEAWNTLEPLLTLCLASLPDASAGQTNLPPLAAPDTLTSGVNARRLISHTLLLGNDEDPENGILAIQSVSGSSSQGGSVLLSQSFVAYTPPQDFEGTDSFAYTIEDEFGATSTSQLTIDVSSLVDVQVGIVLDGDLSDWPNEHSIVTDPSDLSNPSALIDLQELHMYHQEGELYLAYKNEGPISLNWGYNLFIDADRNSSTGFAYYDIGADYVINDKTLLRYSGNGSDWTWSYVGDINIRIKEQTAEISFPLSSIGSPDAINYAFEGSNAPFGFPNDLDYIPDSITSGPGLKYLTYFFEDSDAIVIDGKISDWPESAIVIQDPKESSTNVDKIDLREISFLSDAENLFLAYRNEYPVELNWGYQVLIDTDGLATTGFVFYEFGADYIIYDGGVFKYQGTGTDWNWAFVGAPSKAIDGEVLEMSFPKEWLGDPNLPSFNFIFIGDNEANGGTLVDAIPDGAILENIQPSALTVQLSQDPAPTNVPPVLNDDSVTVDFGGTVLISVLNNDSDPGGSIDPSTLEIVTAPQTGAAIIAAAQGGILYQHDSTIAGTFSFTYRVADEKGLFGSPATVNYTIKQPIATGPNNPVVDMTIDGLLTDWEGITPIGLDPKDATQPGDELDWKVIYTAHNKNNLYIAYESWLPISLNWAHNIYIDSDYSQSTGFQYANLGCDYLIQQGVLFRYSGNGTSWSWEFVLDTFQSVSGTVVEMSIPRESIGNPSRIRSIFYGENVAYPGGETLDFFPDGGLAYDYNFLSEGQNLPPIAQDQNYSTLEGLPVSIELKAVDPENQPLVYTILEQPMNGVLSGELPELTYTPGAAFLGRDEFYWSASDGEETTGSQKVSLEVIPEPVSGYPSYPLAQITLDGSLTEWSGIPSLGSDPIDSSQQNQTTLDFREIWMGHTPEDLLLAMRIENDAQIGWAYNVFLDSDVSSATGYRGGNGNLGIGGDFLLQGQFLFQYSGSGTDWSWAFISAIPHAYSNLQHEWKIPTSSIGSSSQIHFVLRSDNAAYGADLPDDAMPDIASGQGQSYFRYKITQSVPVSQQNLDTQEAIDIRRTQPFVIQLVPFIPAAQQSRPSPDNSDLKLLNLFLSGFPGDEWVMEYSHDLNQWFEAGSVQLLRFQTLWAPTAKFDHETTFFRARQAPQTPSLSQ